MLVRVVAPHFVAGLVLTDDTCTDAAPIMRWAIGKHRAFLSEYFRRKGWKAAIIPCRAKPVSNPE